ncbi:MAG: DUF3656 domain-containing protein [Bacillota bacterium]|nr:DUF3656 domain-containing protein [Bacillota bacterium]
MFKGKKPELLAPAGGPQALRAAVENGADAVYLGGRSFGARAYAENFTRKELIDALRYAHVRGVKVYVTVNTLVDNREFGRLADYLFFLYWEGVDALLVQDLGVARFIRGLLPDFPLHGSTQMTVHNAAGVKFLAGLGFSRVVLARETSFENLRAIRRQAPLELEIFVHGALCICYSGQCLFSSLVGGRSGNRGRCAQPCRLPYTLVDERERDLSTGCVGHHLLSPKDLMLIQELPALIQIGIDALKIEGRMKRPEYVATVVRIYRNALDRAFRDPEHYRVTPEEVRDLAQIFNRGFTTGYFYGNPRQALMGYQKPNNRGLYLGRVIQARPHHQKVVIRTRVPLQVGDGIEFWTKGGGREGLSVSSLFVRGRSQKEVEPESEVEISVPFPVKPGDRIFKIHDQRLMQLARESFTGPAQRRIPIVVRAQARLEEPLILEAWDPEGLHVTARGNFPGERASKHPLIPEVLRAQVDRLGNTPFSLAGFDCEVEQGVMFPLSEINAVRRSLVASLEEVRLQRFKRILPEDVQNRATSFWGSLRTRAQAARKFPLRPFLAVAVSDYAGLQAALTGGADVLYFGGISYRGREPWDWDRVARGVAVCRERGVGAYLIIPRIWQERDKGNVCESLEKARELSCDGVLVGDLGGLFLALQKGFHVVTDFSVPVFNDPAVLMLLERGGIRFTLSPELNREQLEKFLFRETPFLEFLVHGAVPVMISEHCAAGAVTAKGNPCPRICEKSSCYLKDRRGYLFPLMMDEKCRMTLYNARELCLIEYINDVFAAGYGTIRLELRFYRADLVREITAIYRRACDLFQTGCWEKGSGKESWDRLAQIAPLGLTRGHYLRGVLGEAEGGLEELDGQVFSEKT